MIYLPNSNFNFSSLHFISPSSTTNGNIIKFRINDEPLYVQLPKCITRQSFQKVGKKLTCDLLFTIENEQFIQWLEKLELLCVSEIFNNKDKWFKTDLSEEDIENSFTNSLKLYKSGKFYGLKTIVPTHLGNCCINIYNEKEKLLNPDVIQENTNVISIVEIVGIKCTARNFSIEFEIKQIMYIEPVVMFEKCVLKTNSTVEKLNCENNEDLQKQNNDFQEQSQTNVQANNVNTNADQGLKQNNVNSHFELEDVSNSLIIESDENDLPHLSNVNNKKEISEVEINVDSLQEDEVKLNPRNDIYYNLYREAKKRAKDARDLAISSYLEAKNIRNTYLLNQLNESDEEEEINHLKHLHT